MLAAAFFAFNIANAQSHQELKGPAAKNYKPWKQQARTGTLMVKVDETPKKGPAFKNKKRWQSESKKVDIPSDLVVRERITGPKAKNRKPWKN
jgi:hypothetical protein